MPLRSLVRSLAPLFLTAAVAMPVQAQPSDDTAGQQLFDALALPETIEVMRREGMDYAAGIAEDLFPDRAGTWRGRVEEIYDIDVMTAAVEAEFAAALDGADIAVMLDFFTSEPGRSIVAREVDAREALLDEATEQAAQETAAVAMQDGTGRFRLVEQLVEINDLVENNVVGALNSNYAFYVGLMDGDRLAVPIEEDQLLSDIWGQEAEIRADTSEWLYSYLMAAYEPLSDADLQSYVAFSQSDAGQALNRAYFDAFAEMFDDLSMALGRAAARHMVGQEI